MSLFVAHPQQAFSLSLFVVVDVVGYFFFSFATRLSLSLFAIGPE